MKSINNSDVLIITKSISSIGGVEEVVDLHCKSFLKNNFSVKILSIENKNKKYSKEYKNINSVFVKEKKGLFSLGLGLGFFKELIKYASKSSIIVCHQPFATGLVALIFLSFFKKYIFPKKSNLGVYVYIHCLPSRTILHRFIYFFVMRFIFLFNPEFQILISSFSSDNKFLLNNLKNKITKLIIPISKIPDIEINQVPPKDKFIVDNFISIKNKYKNRNIAVFIGRIAFYKGLVNLVKAYQNSENFPILFIFGVGSYANKIKEMLDLRRTKSDIYFFNNYIQEITKFYVIQNSDIYYFPSITNSEAYGIAQLEALSCGVPVLNTNLGTGVNEICRDMIHGVTVKKYNSIKSIKQSILKINKLKSQGFFINQSLKDYVIRNFSHAEYEKQFNNSFFNNY